MIRAQISLRTFFIAISICALITAFCAERVRHAQLEKGVVDFVEMHGGHCFYDYELDGEGQLTGCTTTTPLWLRNLLGGDPLAYVVEVDCSGAVLDEVILGQIASCPRIRTLYLHQCRFDPDAIECLSRCKGLESLSLQEATVTDSLGQTLSKMPALQWIVLARTGISDKTVECLGDCPNLLTVDLTDTNVTDSGIRHLEHIAPLQYLYLRGTQVTAGEAARFRTMLPKCSVVR